MFTTNDSSASVILSESGAFAAGVEGPASRFCCCSCLFSLIPPQRFVILSEAKNPRISLLFLPLPLLLPLHLHLG
jgi:hypothetical protein